MISISSELNIAWARCKSRTFRPSRAQLSLLSCHQDHPIGDMATQLKKVSENYHLTLKRARIATDVSTSHVFPDALSGHDESPQLQIKIVFHPAFPGKHRPPGLYTAIAHNVPLRRRIQDHLDELQEFKALVRHIQGLLSGWLVTLFHVIPVVGSASGRPIGPHEPRVRARISENPFTGISKFGGGTGVHGRSRSTSKGKDVAHVAPVNAQFVNGATILDAIKPGGVTPASLDNLNFWSTANKRNP
ncbi:hypothetical protein BC826DRAFT_1183462 [Russula brevipes]|nr:hypothetical protein BC826DRAFT_1183462 [Russula brevipes]